MDGRGMDDARNMELEILRKELDAARSTVKLREAELEAERKARKAARSTVKLREAELEAERKAKKAARSTVKLREAELEAMRMARKAERDARNSFKGKEVKRNIWLRQSLPELNVVRKYSKNVTGRYDFYKPHFVKQWKTFSTEAREFESGGVMTGIVLEFPKSQIANLKSDQLKDDTSAIVTMLTVLKYIKQCKYGWRVEPGPKLGTIIRARVSSIETKRDDLKVLNIFDRQKYEPDITVQSKEAKHLLPLEMKPPGSFSMDGVEAGDLVQTYYGSSQESLHHRDCVNQLMMYMANLKVGFGVLSSAEFTYFVCRVKGNQNQDDALEVLEAIRFTSLEPTLLEGLFYIIVQSMTSMENGQQFSFDRGTQDGKEDAAEDGSFLERKNKENMDVSERKSKRNKISKTLPGGTRKFEQNTSAVRHCDLQYTESSDLHLEEMPYSCTGLSGDIGLGCINGQRVSIKFAFVDTLEAEALHKEITAYKILQRYWGTYVAELVKYGTTVGGKVMFVATKFIEDSEIWGRALSEAEGRAAEEALDAIHYCGLLHGDVHGGNILFTEGQALFIDFGFSQPITEKADCAKERNQLRGILQKFTSTVTES